MYTSVDTEPQENGLDQASLEIMLFKDNAKKHPVFWRQIGKKQCRGKFNTVIV